MQIHKVGVTEKGSRMKGLPPEKFFSIRIVLEQIKSELDKAGLALTMHENIKDSSDPLIKILPQAYKHHLPFLYAHSFLFSLDNIYKAMKVLENKEKTPSLSTKIRENLRLSIKNFETSLPNLTSIRNSAHHPEDRIRLKSRWEKDFQPKSLVTPEIHAPNAEILLVSTMLGNRLTYTSEKGEHHEIEISKNTLIIAERSVQAFFDAFEWE